MGHIESVYDLALQNDQLKSRLAEAQRQLEIALKDLEGSITQSSGCVFADVGRPCKKQSCAACGFIGKSREDLILELTASQERERVLRGAMENVKTEALKSTEYRSRLLAIYDVANDALRAMPDKPAQARTEPTDTERLDWLESYITSKDVRPDLGYKCAIHDLKVFSVIPKSQLAHDSIREAIDAAQASAEGKPE